MVIRFLCPNGHQLSAPETMAGKAGKCPKCGLAFAVPTLEELGAAEQDTAHDEPPSEAPPEEEPAASHSSGTVNLNAATATGAAKGNTFAFLCPNGHKLNGPPSLKGKAGKCPHCGARFRIPSDEDLADEGESTEPPHDEVPADEPIDAEIAEETNPEMQEEIPEEPEQPGIEEVYVEPPPEEGHALGYVFARLWDQRYEGSEVEISLKDGEIYIPEFYCDNLSCREYGVFANANGDEQFSFTLLNWDDVRKVSIKKLPVLPRPMFR